MHHEENLKNSNLFDMGSTYCQYRNGNSRHVVCTCLVVVVRCSRMFKWPQKKQNRHSCQFCFFQLLFYCKVPFAYFRSSKQSHPLNVGANKFQENSIPESPNHIFAVNFYSLTYHLVFCSWNVSLELTYRSCSSDWIIAMPVILVLRLTVCLNRYTYMGYKMCELTNNIN